MTRAARVRAALSAAAALGLASYLAVPANASSRPVPARASGQHAAANATARPVYVGGYAGNSVTDWLSASQPSQIGPLQVEKDWFPTSTPPRMLPSSFHDTMCYKLYIRTPSQDPVCLISYKDTTPTGQLVNTPLKSFIASIPPAHAPVIMIFYMEPEVTLWDYNCAGTLKRKPAYSSGAQYVQEFEAQSSLIRKYAAQDGLTNVQVADGAGVDAYNPQTHGGGCKSEDYYGSNCSYIPPPAYVNHYLTEVYHPHLVLLQSDARFQRWNSCTRGLHKTRGISDYALGNCTTNGSTFTEADREAVLADDAAYLGRQFPTLYLWSYFWFQLPHLAKCEAYKFPAASSSSPQTAREWEAIEAGTVKS